MVNFGQESETVEFKKSTSEINEGIISITSILNKVGYGTLYFGVKNNGDGVGQQISESTLRDISRKISEDIKPTIYPSIYEIENSPGIIRVDFNGRNRPYSAKGKFYIRVFDEDKQMDVTKLLSEINEIDKSNSVWERMPSEEGIESIDDELLKSYIKKANKCGRISDDYSNPKEILSKLGLLTDEKLNNAGRLLFSKNKPLLLKLAVFTTDEKLSFIDISRFEGNIFELAKKGQDYIKEHINYSADIVGDKRVEMPEIPIEAIREVVMNSLCHSSYDISISNEIYITPSKVAVFNPGSFPHGYEPKDFAYNGVESILRNPLIAKVLYYSNDIDSWATGFRRIYKVCDEAKIRTVYSMNNQGFEFAFLRNRSSSTSVDKYDCVLSLLRENPLITTDEIAQEIGKSRRTVQNIINKLKKDGEIERIGSNKNGHWEIIKRL